MSNGRVFFRERWATALALAMRAPFVPRTSVPPPVYGRRVCHSEGKLSMGIGALQGKNVIGSFLEWLSVVLQRDTDARCRGKQTLTHDRYRDVAGKTF